MRYFVNKFNTHITAVFFKTESDINLNFIRHIKTVTLHGPR